MNGKAIVENSITGQKWQWRGNSVDARDANFTPDDLVTQLLLARGVARDDLERHRNPTLRAFMPDQSIVMSLPPSDE